MAAKKASDRQPLSHVLNIRIDEALEREIERIAQVQQCSPSEAARQLLLHGVEVQRQVEASYLRLPYTLDRESADGRIVIEAAWRVYTDREIWEREREIRDRIAEAEEFGY